MFDNAAHELRLDPTLEAAVRRAISRLAPVWRLEDFVAVNPYLGWTDTDARLAALQLWRAAGARSTMPVAHRLGQIAEGAIDTASVAAALAAARPQGQPDVAAFISEAAAVGEVDTTPPRLTRSGVLAGPGGLDLERFGVERLGAFAAAHHDEGQAMWRTGSGTSGLYASWRAETAVDRTAELMGLRGLRAVVRSLPEDPTAALGEVLASLELDDEPLELYLAALLLWANGWSSVAARMDWELGLRGETGGNLLEWLAVVTCWDHAVSMALHDDDGLSRWRRRLTTRVEQDDPALEVAWVLQDAADRAARGRLSAALSSTLAQSEELRAEQPRAQVVCCIDVRSEVLRRHLESVAPDVETLGFAGFFGAPVEVLPLGHDHAVAQCPALLAPAHSLQATLADPGRTERAVSSRRLRHQLHSAWKQFKTGALSCYGFVSPIGLFYAPKLVSDAFGRSRPVPDPVTAELPRWARTEAPQLAASLRGLELDQRVSMAAGALRAMSLGGGTAALLVLVGHGSTTVNNPHAAALECGACGGHSGADNARVMAALLNDPEVRAELSARGVRLDEHTHVVAALHDTATDEVRLLDLDSVPESHRAGLDRLRDELDRAGALVRAERMERFGLGDVDAAAEVHRRSTDWAQVRPEWGLAGCRAFIAAPRSRTAGLDLGSEVFLHSYDWQLDTEHAVLEQIMTAPMVVASWITLQYYGSTVDPQLWGAGDKTLHNVVGRVGVLEGCGGDLRVGLARQSVHDGRGYQHDPLRLTVVIEAPCEPIDAVLARNEAVAALVDNGWVLLHSIDPDDATIRVRVGPGRWQVVGGSELEDDALAVGPLDRGARGPDVVDVVG